MGCVVLTDRFGVVDWIGLFGMDGLGSGSCWVIGDGDAPVGEILIGGDDWRQWCLAVFGVCRRFLGVMCVGHALCQAMHLG